MKQFAGPPSRKLEKELEKQYTRKKFLYPKKITPQEWFDNGSGKAREDETTQTPLTSLPASFIPAPFGYQNECPTGSFKGFTKVAGLEEKIDLLTNKYEKSVEKNRRDKYKAKNWQSTEASHDALKKGIRGLSEEDPTPNKQYLEWLVRQVYANNYQYEKGELYDLLQRFEGAKKSRKILTDINIYKTPGQLYDAVEKSEGGEGRGWEAGAPVVLDKPPYRVIRLDSQKAATKLCKGTEWCVRAPNMYKYYSEQGPLYLVQKNGKPYALVHYESGQVRDSQDRSLLEGPTKEVLSVLEPITGKSYEDWRKSIAASILEYVKIFAEVEPNLSGQELFNYLHGSLEETAVVQDPPPEWAGDVWIVDEVIRDFVQTKIPQEESKVFASIRGLTKNAAKKAKPFYLNRKEDETGISGTGIVAYGVELPTGKVVIEWATDTSSITIFNNKEDMLKVHGHDGKTELVYMKEVSGSLRGFNKKSWVPGLEMRPAQDADKFSHVFYKGQFIGTILFSPKRNSWGWSFSKSGPWKWGYPFDVVATEVLLKNWSNTQRTAQVQPGALLTAPSPAGALVDSPQVEIDPTIREEIQDAVEQLRASNPNYFKGISKIVALNSGPYGQVSSDDPTVIHLNVSRIKNEIKSKFGGFNENNPEHREAFEEAVKVALIEVIAHEHGHVMDWDPEQHKFPGGEGAAEREVQIIMPKMSGTRGFCKKATWEEEDDPTRAGDWWKPKEEKTSDFFDPAESWKPKEERDKSPYDFEKLPFTPFWKKKMVFNPKELDVVPKLDKPEDAYALNIHNLKEKMTDFALNVYPKKVVEINKELIEHDTNLIQSWEDALGSDNTLMIEFMDQSDISPSVYSEEEINRANLENDMPLILKTWDNIVRDNPGIETEIDKRIKELTKDQSSPIPSKKELEEWFKASRAKGFCKRAVNLSEIISTLSCFYNPTTKEHDLTAGGAPVNQLEDWDYYPMLKKSKVVSFDDGLDAIFKFGHIQEEVKKDSAPGQILKSFLKYVDESRGEFRLWSDMPRSALHLSYIPESLVPPITHEKIEEQMPGEVPSTEELERWFKTSRARSLCKRAVWEEGDDPDWWKPKEGENLKDWADAAAKAGISGKDWQNVVNFMKGDFRHLSEEHIKKHIQDNLEAVRDTERARDDPAMREQMAEDLRATGADEEEIALYSSIEGYSNTIKDLWIEIEGLQKELAKRESDRKEGIPSVEDLGQMFKFQGIRGFTKQAKEKVLPLDAVWYSPDGGFARVWMMSETGNRAFWKVKGNWREVEGQFWQFGQMISPNSRSVKEIRQQFFGQSPWSAESSLRGFTKAAADPGLEKIWDYFLRSYWPKAMGREWQRIQAEWSAEEFEGREVKKENVDWTVILTDVWEEYTNELHDHLLDKGWDTEKITKYLEQLDDKVLEHIQQMPQLHKRAHIIGAQGKKKLTIGIDIDDVIADFHKILFETASKYIPLDEDDKKQYRIQDVKHGSQEVKDKVFEELHDRDLIANMPAIPGAVEKINELHDKGHKIILITARSEGWKDETEQWLRNVGLKYDKLILTDHEGKSKFAREEKINVFIDDRPDWVESLVDVGDVRVLVFDQPWNTEVNVPRIKDWKQVRAFIKTAQYSSDTLTEWQQALEGIEEKSGKRVNASKELPTLWQEVLVRAYQEGGDQLVDAFNAHELIPNIAVVIPMQKGQEMAVHGVAEDEGLWISLYLGENIVEKVREGDIKLVGYINQVVMHEYKHIMDRFTKSKEWQAESAGERIGYDEEKQDIREQLRGGLSADALEYLNERYAELKSETSAIAAEVAEAVRDLKEQGYDLPYIEKFVTDRSLELRGWEHTRGLELLLEKLIKEAYNKNEISKGTIEKEVQETLKQEPWWHKLMRKFKLAQTSQQPLKGECPESEEVVYVSISDLVKNDYKADCPEGKRRLEKMKPVSTEEYMKHKKEEEKKEADLEGFTKFSSPRWTTEEKNRLKELYLKYRDRGYPHHVIYKAVAHLLDKSWLAVKQKLESMYDLDEELQPFKYNHWDKEKIDQMLQDLYRGGKPFNRLGLPATLMYQITNHAMPKAETCGFPPYYDSFDHAMANTILTVGFEREGDKLTEKPIKTLEDAMKFYRRQEKLCHAWTKDEIIALLRDAHVAGLPLTHSFFKQHPDIYKPLIGVGRSLEGLKDSMKRNGYSWADMVIEAAPEYVDLYNDEGKLRCSTEELRIRRFLELNNIPFRVATIRDKIAVSDPGLLELGYKHFVPDFFILDKDGNTQGIVEVFGSIADSMASNTSDIYREKRQAKENFYKTLPYQFVAINNNTDGVDLTDEILRERFGPFMQR